VDSVGLRICEIMWFHVELKQQVCFVIGRLSIGIEVFAMLEKNSSLRDSQKW